LKKTLRTAIFLSMACAAVTAFSSFAQAQKIDVAFGVSTMLAPSAGSADGINHLPQSLTGGAYPGFTADVLFWHNVGIQGEVFWKASQGDYLASGVGYRPVFYDVNAVYVPKLARRTYLELSAGIGAISTRFYTGTNCSGFGCTNYQDSNHFMGDFGAGIKYYPKGKFFIRPEARFYLINNNLDYSSAYATRVGASIGYTF
jgi:Outer membrane protein beta-barrel domain